MKKTNPVHLILVLIFLGWGITGYTTDPFSPSSKPPERIISMAPSLTEVLFALDLGESVVGVSRYCNYPPEAQEKPRVGGLLDPSYEMIVILDPDLVLLTPDQAEIGRALEGLGIHSLIVPQSNIPEILRSIEIIGMLCDTPAKARTMVAGLKSEIDTIQEKTRNIQPTSVLLVIEREVGTGSLGQVYISGEGTYLDELLRLAGGVNACRNVKVKYPIVSTEGILRMNPEVIIEVVSDPLISIPDEKSYLEDWKEMGQVDAVKNHRVHLFSEASSSIPGPRVIQTLKKMVRVLHPELDLK